MAMGAAFAAYSRHGLASLDRRFAAAAATAQATLAAGFARFFGCELMSCAL